MLRRLVLLAILATGMAGIARADMNGLKRLDTSDDSRGWEAVGRLDIDGRGFCTGALIAPDIVLTAAHCLYDMTTKHRIDPARIEFLADWRNGRASARSAVRRAVVHPDYSYEEKNAPKRVRNDVALLELQHPVRKSGVTPFRTDHQPRKDDRLSVVSYGHDRADAPSLQEVCRVVGRQQAVLVMSCDVTFGASGAPIFSFESGEARIVSVVSAMAELDGKKVSLGTRLDEPLATLMNLLEAGTGGFHDEAPEMFKTGDRRDTGAKFAKP